MFKNSYICFVKKGSKDKKVTIFANSRQEVEKKLLKKYSLDSIEKILEPENKITKKEQLKAILFGITLSILLDVTVILGGYYIIQGLIAMFCRVWEVGYTSVTLFFSCFGLYFDYCMIKITYQIITTVIEHKSFFKGNTEDF